MTNDQRSQLISEDSQHISYYYWEYKFIFMIKTYE